MPLNSMLPNKPGASFINEMRRQLKHNTMFLSEPVRLQRVGTKVHFVDCTLKSKYIVGVEN